MATSNETATYIGDLPTSPTIPIDSLAGGRSRLGAEQRKTKEIMRVTLTALTGPVTSTHTELNFVAGVTPGTATASKALVVDASKDIDLGTGDLTATNVTATGVIATGITVINIAATGSMTAVTQSPNDNSTKVATTAYADAAAAAAAFPATFVKATGRGTNGDCVLANNHNSDFTSVNRSAAGVYDVIMASARTDYTVQVTAAKSTGTAISHVRTLTSTTAFTVLCYNDAGTNLDPDFLFITVYGAED